MALFNLIPIPYKTKHINKLGLLTEPWAKFFVKIFERLKILQVEVFLLDISRDETTNLSTGTGKFTFRVPAAFVLSNIRASVNTAPVDSSIIIDVNEDGASVLSTKLSIDDGSKSSKASVAPLVFSDFDLADDSEITVDIDQVGSTTPGKGLKLLFYGTRRN